MRHIERIYTKPFVIGKNICLRHKHILHLRRHLHLFLKTFLFHILLHKTVVLDGDYDEVCKCLEKLQVPD